MENESFKDRNRGFWNRTLTALETCREESTRMMRITKLKWDATRFKRQRMALYRTLGKSAYQLQKSSEISHFQIQEGCSQIDAVTQKIAENEALIQKLSATAFSNLKNS